MDTQKGPPLENININQQSGPESLAQSSLKKDEKSPKGFDQLDQANDQTMIGNKNESFDDISDSVLFENLFKDIDFLQSAYSQEKSISNLDKNSLDINNAIIQSENRVSENLKILNSKLRRKYSLPVEYYTYDLITSNSTTEKYRLFDLVNRRMCCKKIIKASEIPTIALNEIKIVLGIIMQNNSKLLEFYSIEYQPRKNCSIIYECEKGLFSEFLEYRSSISKHWTLKEINLIKKQLRNSMENYESGVIINDLTPDDIILQNDGSLKIYPGKNIGEDQISDFVKRYLGDPEKIQQENNEILVTEAYREGLKEYIKWLYRKILWNIEEEEKKILCFILMRDFSVQEMIEWLQVKKSNFKENSNEKAKTCSLLGCLLIISGRYKESVHLFKESLEIRLNISDANKNEIATTYLNIGKAYDWLSNYKEASFYFEKALELRLELYGEQSPYTASCYNNLGNIYTSQKEYKKALEYHEKALAIRLKMLGENHSDVGSSYNNLGNIYSGENKFEEALKAYNKSLEIELKSLGEFHPSIATCYSNLGDVYDDLKKYSEAEEFYHKSLDLRTQIYGPEHPSVANSLAHLGLVNYHQNKSTEALHYYLKALNIRLKVLGFDHPSIATAYNNIGNIYEQQGKYEEALDVYFKSLEVKRILYGEDHPSVASAYKNIASVYDTLHDVDKALEYYQKCLDVRLKIYDETHKDIASVYFKMANLYVTNNMFNEAVKYYEICLKITLKVAGEDVPETADLCYNLGIAYDFQGDHIKSLYYYLRSIKIRTKVLPTGHIDLSDSFYCISDLFLQKKDHKNSLRTLIKGHFIKRRELGKESAETEAILMRYEGVEQLHMKNDFCLE